jgi:NADPH-dependent curcumin reductase CurA
MGDVGNEEKAVVDSKEWYLTAHALEGVPTSDHLKLRTISLSLAVDSIPDHHLVVQNLLISVDPYNRTRLTGVEDGLYFPPFKLNEVLVTNITRRHYKYTNINICSHKMLYIYIYIYIYIY